MRLGHRQAVLGIAALAAVLTFGTTASAAPISKCNAAKKKCIGKYIAAVMGCHAKAEGKSLAVDPTCLSKAAAKITGGGKGCFDKADVKNDGCSQTGDASSQLSDADAFILDVVNDIDPGYPAPHTNKCDAGEKKCVGKKASGLMGCKAKENKDGVGDPACEPKIEGKFTNGEGKGCIDKLILKNDGPCDGATPAGLEAKTDAWADASAAALDTGAPACPLGGTCGDGCIDPGEFCDPGAPADPAAACGTDFPCNGTTCNCACPTKVEFAGNNAAPESVLDTGWTGISHRAPVISGGDVTVGLSCPGGGTQRPCGTCNITGLQPNGPGKLKSLRCTNDTSVQCTTVGSSAAPCSAGGTCQFYFGGPLPLAAGGVTTCVFNQFNGPVTGTANVESGESTTVVNLTARVYTGITIDNPCARCVGDGTNNDGTAGGSCSGGTRNGMACDGNGSVFGRPDFGTTSLDCPLAAGSLIATLPIDLSSATDPVVKTLSAASPGCSGEPGERCLCDTCNNVAATPCDSNADCTAVGATVCGGKRCIGGTNAGAPCNVNTECPSGGICGRPGEPTKPSACLDDSVGTPGVIDCTDTAASGSATDGEGECTGGPITQHCSVASGHAQRGCIGPGDCGGGAGSCEAENRQCFLTGGFSGKNGTNTLIANGMEDTPMHDTSQPTLGAVFCVGPTGSTSVNNVAGLPGPGRVTIKGLAVAHP